MLFDGTLCVGCRACELACNTDNDLGRTPDEIFEGRLAEDARALGTNVFTYVTFHQWEQDPSTAHFGKVQCMHCIEPACVSSCPVHALHKTELGPVVWDGDICLGCRYCMMACPFLVPRFEWESRNPAIRKCDMCADLQEKGEPPTCVAACPTKALRIGTRSELLELAHQRIVERPRRYVHFTIEDMESFQDALNKIKTLYTEALFRTGRRIAVKEWSEVLGCHLWVVADDEDTKSLRSQGITEAIYTADEVKKLKEMSKDSLREIHKVKETFKNSKVEDLTRKVKN